VVGARAQVKCREKATPINNKVNKRLVRTFIDSTTHKRKTACRSTKKKKRKKEKKKETKLFYYNVIISEMFSRNC
jgi:hypothetical protein